jgi:C_GCAxxG_C_C family probable redox protein
MLRDRIKTYYLEKDYNCAESLLRAANDEYNLNIPEDSFKLIGGFGAGMGCGKSCGAMCGGISAIGQQRITGRAHTTEGLSDICKEYVTQFVQTLGSTECDDLVKKYKKEDVRCLETVLMSADVLEKIMSK